jgi:hypothetical protein
LLRGQQHGWHHLEVLLPLACRLTRWERELERERQAEDRRLRAEADAARAALLKRAVALREACCGSIRDCFEGLPEPRGPRHPLSAVLALVVMAMLRGKTRLNAITAWARSVGQDMPALAGARHRGKDGLLTAPSPKTVTRVPGLLGAQALSDAVSRYLPPRRAPPGRDPPFPPVRPQRAAS